MTAKTKKLSKLGFEEKEEIALYMVISAIFGGAANIARQIQLAGMKDENGKIPLAEDATIVEDGWNQANQLYEDMGIDTPAD